MKCVCGVATIDCTNWIEHYRRVAERERAARIAAEQRAERAEVAGLRQVALAAEVGTVTAAEKIAAWDAQQRKELGR